MHSFITQNAPAVAELREEAVLGRSKRRSLGAQPRDEGRLAAPGSRWLYSGASGVPAPAFRAFMPAGRRGIRASGVSFSATEVCRHDPDLVFVELRHQDSMIS